MADQIVNPEPVQKSGVLVKILQMDHNENGVQVVFNYRLKGRAQWQEGKLNFDVSNSKGQILAEIRRVVANKNAQVTGTPPDFSAEMGRELDLVDLPTAEELAL